MDLMFLLRLDFVVKWEGWTELYGVQEEDYAHAFGKIPFRMARILLGYVDLPTLLDHEQLDGLRNAGFRRGVGETHGNNNCCSDSLIQILASASLIPAELVGRRIWRKELCVALRSSLCAQADEKLQPRWLDQNGVKSGTTIANHRRAFLQHGFHGQAAFRLIFEHVKATLPSRRIDLQVHCRFDSVALPSSNTLLNEGLPGHPEVILHMHNRTGSTATGTHYDPFFGNEGDAIGFGSDGSIPGLGETKPFPPTADKIRMTISKRKFDALPLLEDALMQNASASPNQTSSSSMVTERLEAKIYDHLAAHLPNGDDRVDGGSMREAGTLVLDSIPGLGQENEKGQEPMCRKVTSFAPASLDASGHTSKAVGKNVEEFKPKSEILAQHRGMVPAGSMRTPVPLLSTRERRTLVDQKRKAHRMGAVRPRMACRKTFKVAEGVNAASGITCSSVCASGAKTMQSMLDSREETSTVENMKGGEYEICDDIVEDDDWADGVELRSSCIPSDASKDAIDGESGFDGSELRTRRMPPDAWNDPRALQDRILETMSSLVREIPTVPADPKHLGQPLAAALGMEKAPLLPRKHCSFQGCGWVGDCDEDLLKYLRETHDDALGAIADTFGADFMEDDRYWVAYNKILGSACCRAAPRTSYAVAKLKI